MNPTFCFFCLLFGGSWAAVGMEIAPVTTKFVLSGLIFIGLVLVIWKSKKKPEVVKFEPLPGLSKLDESDKYEAERQKLYQGLGVPNSALAGAAVGAGNWRVNIPEGGIKPSGPVYPHTDPYETAKFMQDKYATMMRSMEDREAKKPVEVSEVDEKTRESIFINGMEKLDDWHDSAFPDYPTPDELMEYIKVQYYHFESVMDDQTILLHQKLPGCIVRLPQDAVVWKSSMDGLPLKYLETFSHVHLLMKLFDIPKVT